jgi:hypothetical protein
LIRSGNDWMGLHCVDCNDSLVNHHSCTTESFRRVQHAFVLTDLTPAAVAHGMCEDALPSDCAWMSEFNVACSGRSTNPSRLRHHGSHCHCQQSHARRQACIVHAPQDTQFSQAGLQEMRNCTTESLRRVQCKFVPTDLTSAAVAHSTCEDALPSDCAWMSELSVASSGNGTNPSSL